MQYATSARGRDEDVTKKMAATTPHAHTHTHTKSAKQVGLSEKSILSSFASLHVQYWSDNQQRICQAFTVMMHSVTNAYTNSY